MKSRARCVPLQYSLTATRGVKIAPTNADSSKQNRVVVSTLLQERDLWLEEESRKSSITDFRSPDPFLQGANKRKMECERYQDCSWFQEKPAAEDVAMETHGKTSPAELVFPDVENNEFDLNMQFANKDTPHWGDEYFEVFDDDLQCENKMVEKCKNIQPNNYSTINYKMGDDSVYDSYNFNDNDYILRKNDSFDMKNISYTDPAEVLPISYRERVNNTNYGLYALDDIKSEVKEEAELYSPQDNAYFVESDDSDLNIGREETIEVEEMPTNENGRDVMKKMKNWSKIEDLGRKTDVKETNDSGISTEVSGGIPRPSGNLMTLDLNKTTFDQPMTLNTPDLDFMDLVDFINNDIGGEPLIPSNSNQQVAATSNAETASCRPEEKASHRFQISSASEKQTATKETVKKTYLAIPRQVTSNSPEDQKLPKMLITDIPLKVPSVALADEMSTINLDDLAFSNGSISERVKAGSKRKRSVRYSIGDLKDESLDDERAEDEDEDDDYDYDEDYEDRKRYGRPKKRTRSSTVSSESSSASRRIKDEDEPLDRYRELRNKNNEASRRSRQNRKDKERDMFKSLEEAERKNVQLKARAEELEKLVISLRNLLLQAVLRKGGGV